MSTFRGTYTVLITPFTPDGSAIDVPALKKLVNWQIEQGIHGLIPLGSTGEFLSMSREERQLVTETVICTANGRVPVLMGTGAEWTPECVELSKEAEDMGADGVMIIPPFYSCPNEDELFAHYRAVGEAISIPIMIYNNPATANVDLLPKTVARLSQIDTVSYIKESTLEVTRVRDIIELCGDRMNVFAGILGYESFWLGACGWVAVASNLLPSQCAQMFEAAADRLDRDAALALYRQILPVVRAVGGPHYVAASKAGLSMMGLDVGIPRAPRLPLADDLHHVLRHELEKLNVLNSFQH
ncbi:dihydrodipicolinate synthase family protein [Erwinia sp. SLM-02]|uniref:dihydrodipicolinate synthase family protein n=1 Tax=Erwinia sp. SLM-02 TaxID=3020057 RepID=UPI0028D3C83E|nr:dihydrodipicolinate synthase family protein [uncultured Erwinia sp.]